MAGLVIPTGTRIPTNETPTIFNKTLSKGAFWGSLVGTVGLVGAGLLAGAAIPLTGGVLLASAGVQAVGALVGGLIGKAQMERERIEGKPVETPSLANGHVFSGLLVGDLISWTLIAGAMVSASPALAAAAVVTNLASIPIGAVAGAIYGKGKMQETVERAEMLQRSRSPEPSRGLGLGVQLEAPGPAVSYHHSVTPGEPAELATRLRSEGTQTGHTERVTGPLIAEDARRTI